MFHPVGSQPPSVYWRRRLLVVGSLVLVVVLLTLTVKAVTSGGGGSAAGGSPHTTPAPRPTATSTTHSTTPPPPTHSAPPSGTGSGPAAAPCQAANLSIQAVAGEKSYKVGAQPVVELQVTNTAATPCVQDLADKQVELRVYNGESRVWGSHDCQIQPGTNLKTLASRTPVRVAVTWSGLTSQPGCTGTRQRVGAGTYTLYAVLAGKTGKATQFTIS